MTDALRKALQELAHCEFNEANCTSLAVASARVRAVARTALQEPAPANQLVEDARAKAIEADAARLDWFDKNCKRPDSSIRLDDGTFKSCTAWAIASAHDDLRAAIDAAIRSIAKGVES